MLTDRILAHERETYETAWMLPQYHAYSPGATYLPTFVAMATPSQDDTILDAGCGSGAGALALRARGFHNVTLCDLVDDGLLPEATALPFRRACLWWPLRPQLPYAPGGAWDWVYCCDVLEHIPPELTMLTIARMLEVTRKGLFLTICLQPDTFGAWVGTPLHRSVLSFVQWRDLIAAVGTIREARDLVGVGVYLVEAR